MEQRKGPEFWLGLAASGLVVLGALIPWVMVRSPIKTDFGRGLPHNYWQLALLAGGVSFIAAARARWALVTSIACFAIALLCLAGTMADILKFCGSLDGLVGCGSDGFLKVGASPGWYLAAVAAVGGLCVQGYTLLRSTDLEPRTPNGPTGIATSVDARPAAWHPDPTGRFDHRYWDGTQWTDQVSRAGVQSTDPVSP